MERLPEVISNVATQLSVPGFVAFGIKFAGVCGLFPFPMKCSAACFGNAFQKRSEDDNAAMGLGGIFFKSLESSWFLQYDAKLCSNNR